MTRLGFLETRQRVQIKSINQSFIYKGDYRNPGPDSQQAIMTSKNSTLTERNLEQDQVHMGDSSVTFSIFAVLLPFSSLGTKRMVKK